jgi:hypothetical protein
MQRKINALLLIGLISTFTLATHLITHLARIYWGDRNIWWTPKTMKLYLSETKNNFELFISGKPLQDHIAKETLFALDEEGKQYCVVGKDIGVRLNNWHKVKASMLGTALYSAFGSGVAITCLVLGLVEIIKDKKKISEQTAQQQPMTKR